MPEDQSDREHFELLTLGYEGIFPDLYFDTILARGAQTLIDVRKVPLSRKPGYSKKRLSEAASARGIGYVHMVELGTPDDIRHDMKNQHGSDEFERRYLEYLDTQTDAVRVLADRVQREVCCLLCVEADIRLCHRRIVADRVVEMIGKESCIVTHLSG